MYISADFTINVLRDNNSMDGLVAKETISHSYEGFFEASQADEYLKQLKSCTSVNISTNNIEKLSSRISNYGIENSEIGDSACCWVLRDEESAFLSCYMEDDELQKTFSFFCESLKHNEFMLRMLADGDGFGHVSGKQDDLSHGVYISEPKFLMMRKDNYV